VIFFTSLILTLFKNLLVVVINRFKFLEKFFSLQKLRSSAPSALAQKEFFHKQYT
jgi:hypothetical protein